jgi:peptidoglycan hydrolase-like protein with peptidoglycan-binding domain
VTARRGVAAPRSGRARKGTAFIGALALAGASTGIYALIAGNRPAAAATSGAVPIGTARIVRTNLVNTVQVAGALGYEDRTTVVDQRSGAAFTALPYVGQVVSRGGALYEVDGRPVVLFYGARPLWRTLALGVSDGADVRQLEENLVALGYANRANLTVDEKFTPATRDAVERWQAAAGRPVTGTVSPGDLVYAAASLRITAVAVNPAAPPQSGSPVLSATSTTEVVTAQLPVADEYLVKAGDTVSITLPGGPAAAAGTVSSISTVASAPSDTTSRDSGSGSGSSATVDMTVRLNDAHATGNLDQAPVTVDITSAHADNVLAVPIGSLIALAGGGYAVRVIQGANSHLVAVTTGLYSDTLVQIVGSGLAAGTTVEVPAT